MSILCYIVDDQAHGIQAVSELIKVRTELKLVGSDTDADTAMNKILTGVIKVDILFLDIDMPEVSGIDFFEKIGNLAVVIFVTGHLHFALKAIQLGAADYLTKPIQLDDFIRAIGRAKEKLLARDRLSVPDFWERIIFVKLTPKNKVKLNLQNLIYVSVNDKYIDLHVGQQKPITIKKNLSDMEDILPKDMFLRVHKSHLINMAYVESVVGNKIIMKDAPVLDIGSTYMTIVHSRFDSI